MHRLKSGQQERALALGGLTGVESQSISTRLGGIDYSDFRKAAFRFKTSKNPLENEDLTEDWWRWIIESAEEPVFPTGVTTAERLSAMALTPVLEVK